MCGSGTWSPHAGDAGALRGGVAGPEDLQAGFERGLGSAREARLLQEAPQESRADQDGDGGHGEHAGLDRDEEPAEPAAEATGGRLAIGDVFWRHGAAPLTAEIPTPFSQGCRRSRAAAAAQRRSRGGGKPSESRMTRTSCNTPGSPKTTNLP